MSFPPHEMGPPMETPMNLDVNSSCRDSYHIPNTGPYQYVSQTLYTGFLVCGRSADAIKKEKVDTYMRRSTPRNEPDQVTKLRREAYENGRNAGVFPLLTPAVSQAAACDGTRITTTAADDQEIAPGTVPIY